MALNEAAKATINLLNNGAGFPLAPNNIDVTKAAFPILMDTIINVTANGNGDALAAVGLVNNTPCMCWVSEAGPDGYQMVNTMPSPPKLSKLKRFIIEVRWRISRAWNVLVNKDE